MSAENEQIARRFLAAYDELNWNTWTQLCHPDHQFYFPLAPGVLAGTDIGV